jgi:hypothetical protein
MPPINISFINNYLPLAGGIMTGNLSLTTVSGLNPLYISSTNANANNCIQLIMHI